MRGKIIGIIFILIIIQTITATAYPDNKKDIQWYGSKSSRLEQWENFEVNHNGNTYKIEAIDFSIQPDVSPYVFIRLYKNNNTTPELFTVLIEGEPVIHKEVKLEVLDIIRTGKRWSREEYKPWAVIQISFRDVADFAVNLSNNEYIVPPVWGLWGYITIPITIKNIGNADARSVKLIIDPGGLFLDNEQILIGPMKKGETKDYILNFKVPKSLLNDPPPYYKIDILVRSEDIEKTLENFIKIRPQFSDSDIIITKQVSPPNADICGNAVVEIILKNKGLYGIKNIDVSDETPTYFEPDNATSWTISILKPGEEKKISYLIKMNENIRQGEYTLPSTKASFKFGGDIYIKISNNPKIYIQYVPIKSTDSLDLVLFSSKPNVSRGEETVISLSATIKRKYPYFKLVLTAPSGIDIFGSEGAQNTAGGFIIEKQFNLLGQLRPEEKINVITLRVRANEAGYYLIKGNAMLYYPRGTKSEVNVCMPLLVNP